MERVNGITQFLPATHTTILTLLRKHPPDGTTRTRRHTVHTSDIAYYSIYRPLKDERLSWPSWLTYSGRLTHINGHRSATGRAWDRKVRRSKTNILPLCNATKLWLTHVPANDCSCLLCTLSVYITRVLVLTENFICIGYTQLNW